MSQEKLEEPKLIEVNMSDNLLYSLKMWMMMNLMLLIIIMQFIHLAFRCQMTNDVEATKVRMTT